VSRLHRHFSNLTRKLILLVIRGIYTAEIRNGIVWTADFDQGVKMTTWRQWAWIRLQRLHTATHTVTGNSVDTPSADLPNTQYQATNFVTEQQNMHAMQVRSIAVFWLIRPYLFVQWKYQQ